MSALACLRLLPLLLLACAHTPAEAHVSAPDEGTLLQLEQELFAAIEAKDEARLEELLAEDFVLHVPGSAPAGRAAFLAGVRSIPGTVVSVEGHGVRARLYGEVGILTGTQRARVRLPDGSVVTSEGVFTDVALWRGGQWLLVQAHNVELPEPAATRD